MQDYLISCESTVDLTKEQLSERGIAFAPFHFHMDGAEYADDFGESMSLSEFYGRMERGSVSTTSQVSVGAYEALWEPALSGGRDVLHLTLSSGISGTYNAACIAAKLMQEKYPDRKLYVLDSRNASAGYGLFVDLAADGRDQGMGIDALYASLSEARDGVNAWFYTDDLTYLCRGGRVSKTACTFGTVLRICPLMRINAEGKLVPYAKCRGKKRAREACADRMLALAEGGAAYTGPCYISHSACLDEAQALAACIVARIPALSGKIRFYDIGTVIGSHTGPGTVALFFRGEAKAE